jgi:transposase-like protein
VTRHQNYFPARSCAYRDCRAHFRHPDHDPDSVHLVRKGFFFRSSDSRLIRRLQCRSCRRTFSLATRSECFGQKKRHLNSTIEKLFCSGISQRRAARLLGVTQNTIARKLVFLGTRAARLNRNFLIERVRSSGPFVDLQFDEMESFEHSRCLPLSIPLVVEAGSRKILGFGVGSMPAKGLLARISVKKYGPRKDDRPRIASELWSGLRPFLSPSPRILSDMNPRYPSWIHPHFANAVHSTVKGRRGCVVGLDELKRGGFDPLFSLNHTAAMLRANVNRLFRKTWCTTKKAERLALHLAIYAHYHNRVLT